MINGQYAQPGAFDNRDTRDRREEYPVPSYPIPGSSPPTSASPFAFAPPPLSSVPGSSRPAATTMHSEQTASQDYSNYYARSGQPPAPAPNGNAGGNGSTYPGYSGSHPVAYRSVSGETTRAPPPAPLNRVPSFSMMGTAAVSSQASPTTASPYYQQAPRAGVQYPSAQHSPRGTSLYTQQGGYYSATPYGNPTALDMPRSLSYPNYSGTPYGNYLPSMSSPALVHPGDGLPPLVRHGSTNSIGAVASAGPAIGYSFANRLPLVDRPFKCDQCVQSFNRNHDLKRHKRIHLSVKPYGCEKCGKTFSRKDALRRHWMVRGCRGEEGATAPITPNYPLNGPPPPALSPPTPPTNSNSSASSNKNDKDKEGNGYASNPMSFSHPAAPPPLSTLPPRQASDQPSQIILTPSEVQQSGRSGATSGESAESAVIDPALSSLDSGALSSARTSSTNETNEGSYFDVMRKDVPDSATSSTFSRYGNSPKDDMRHHPYRRSPLPSPHQAGHQMGPDGKPIYMSYSNHSNLLAPINSEDMHKDGNEDAGDPSWNRWNHRPPFPFPQPH